MKVHEAPHLMKDTVWLSLVDVSKDVETEEV